MKERRLLKCAGVTMMFTTDIIVDALPTLSVVELLIIMCQRMILAVSILTSVGKSFFLLSEHIRHHIYSNKRIRDN